MPKSHGNPSECYEAFFQSTASIARLRNMCQRGSYSRGFSASWKKTRIALLRTRDPNCLTTKPRLSSRTMRFGPLTNHSDEDVLTTQLSGFRRTRASVSFMFPFVIPCGIFDIPLPISKRTLRTREPRINANECTLSWQGVACCGTLAHGG